MVGNGFVATAVAFARTHHVSSGVFEHRNQVGNHVALSVEVLDGFEYSGTLPLPAVEFGLEVPSVALPQGYVGIVKAFGGFDAVVYQGYERKFTLRALEVFVGK